MKDALIIIGIILGVILVAILVYSIVIYKFTLKEHKKLFSKRFESDSRITFYTKEQFGLDFKPLEVDIPNATLKGGIYSYPNPKENAVFVYAHGMWSGVCAYMQDIEFFCKKGYKVIALNHEGTDSSTGDNIRGLSNSLRCLDYTINYIKNSDEFKNKDIYVAGHSWGGFATLNILNYHKDIKGVIAFAPFLDLKSCLATTIPKGYQLIAPFYKMIERKLCGEYANANAIDALNDYDGKVVVLHAKNDNFVNFEHNTKVLMKKYPNYKYIISDDRYHNPHYTDDALKLMLEYYQKIKTFDNEDDKTKYMKSFDYAKMGELDNSVMEEAFNLLMN